MATEFPFLTAERYFSFPSAEKSSKEGIVAIGGNLSPGMLLSAYRQGIFPWYSEGDPILWWSPHPRFVLDPSDHHMSRSLARFLRKRPFTFSVDRAFDRVIRLCATVSRHGQVGTWITSEMESAYVELHELGHAHSIEVWWKGRLVGGLYGICVGTVVAGESMFSLVDNASKAALAVLASALARRHGALIDCQVRTDHLAAAGAVFIPRRRYLDILKAGLIARPLDDLWRPETRIDEALDARLAQSAARRAGRRSKSGIADSTANH